MSYEGKPGGKDFKFAIMVGRFSRTGWPVSSNPVSLFFVARSINIHASCVPATLGTYALMPDYLTASSPIVLPRPKGRMTGMSGLIVHAVSPVSEPETA
jgi:hypothetical protein